MRNLKEANTKKLPVTAKWLKIKGMYETGSNGKREFGENFTPGGELDTLVLDFIEMLGDITYRFGFQCEVESIKMDLWKERIDSVLVGAGLLRTKPQHVREESYTRNNERIYTFEDNIEDFYVEQNIEKELSKTEWDKYVSGIVEKVN